MSEQQANFFYRTDTEDPPAPITWLDTDNAVVDFSTGWTFECELITYADTPVVEKTLGNANIAGGATSPNILLNWPEDFFSDVPPARYKLRLLATETATGKTREFAQDNPPTIEVGTAPASA